MSTLDPTKTAIAWPAETQDTIIFADVFTLNIANNVGSSSWTVDTRYAGNLGPGLPFGIYSYDGQTWWEFRSPEMLTSNGALDMGIQSLDSGSFATNVIMPFTINSTIPGYAPGANVPVQVKIGLFALPQASLLSKPITGPKVINYHQPVNYAKIKNQGEISKIPSGTVTVFHGAGYVPSFRVWNHTGGLYKPASQAGFLGGGLMIDANYLYLSALSVDSGSWVWRTYIEA